MKSIRSNGQFSPPDARQISRVLVNQRQQANQSSQRPVVRAAISSAGGHFSNHPNDELLTNAHDNFSQRADQAMEARPQRAEFGQHAEEEEEGNRRGENLREVYLVNCCGLTRELKPAHEHLGTFRLWFQVFNTLVFLFGLANFGMGLWFRIDPKVYEIHKYIETQNYTIAGWIMLFGGFLACLMALLGAVAVMKRSISMLLFYLFVVIGLELSSVSAIIMLTIYGLGSALELFIIKELYEQIRRRTMNTDSELFISNQAVQFLDYVQVKMRCCGAADFRDYQKLGMVIPTTCYTIAGNYINAPGCGRAIRRLLDIRAGMATGFGVGSAVSQLLASLFCALLICSIYNLRATPTRRATANEPPTRGPLPPPQSPARPLTAS